MRISSEKMSEEHHCAYTHTDKQNQQKVSLIVLQGYFSSHNLHYQIQEYHGAYYRDNSGVRQTILEIEQVAHK